MPLATVTNITALPTPPSSALPGSFNTQADLFLGALPTLRSEINTISQSNYTNTLYAEERATAAQSSASNALTSENAALSSAQTAGTSAGATAWVSGGTYAVGNVRWSPANRLVYRCISPVSGSAVDPSTNGTNWALVVNPAPQVFVITGTTVTLLAGQHAILTNVATSTVTLPATPTVGDVCWITTANGLLTNIVNPGSNKIMSTSGNMIIDLYNGHVPLRYVNSTLGWILI